MKEIEKEVIKKFKDLGDREFKNERVTKDDLLSYMDYIVLLSILEKLECELTECSDNYFTLFECSICKEVWNFENDGPKENKYNYCPNCGARVIKINYICKD